MKRISLLLGLLSFFICACSREKTLLIKNVTEKYENLAVTVKINNKTVFNDTVKKTDVSLNYYEKRFSVDGDSICVDVDIPVLSLKGHSCAVAAQGKIVIVTISETVRQDSMLFKAPKISIAFLKQPLDKIY